MPLCILKMGKMPKTLMKMRKMYNRIAYFCAFRKWAKCQKRFETNKCKNIPMKTRKMYNRATCLCVFQKWAKCQKRLRKRENVQPGNMPLCISKMGQMPKTLMKTRKMYNRATCLCAFRKWAKCQKRLKSTELIKSFIIEVRLRGK